MNMRLALLILIMAFGGRVAAQTSESPDKVRGEGTLIKLVDPIYPPLTRQARITGDVEVVVAIQRDGSLESARLVEGHPMLAVAALDSARRSTFECGGCTEDVTSYALKYKFQLKSREHPCDSDSYNEQTAALN